MCTFGSLSGPAKFVRSLHRRLGIFFSERVFYKRKKLRHSVRETLAEEYAKIVNALGEVASTSTARVNLHFHCI